MKMLRLTKHNTTHSQREEIKRIWGDIEVKMNSTILPSSSRHAVDVFDQLALNVDVAEVVLPINLIEAILNHSIFCRRGGILVKANMIKKGADVFEFDYYEEIESIKVQSRRL